MITLCCNVHKLWQRMLPSGVYTSTDQPAPLDTGSDACRPWTSFLILTVLLHNSAEPQSSVWVSSTMFTVTACLEHLVSPVNWLYLPDAVSLKTGFYTTCLVVREVKHLVSLRVSHKTHHIDYPQTSVVWASSYVDWAGVSSILTDFPTTTEEGREQCRS